MNFVYLKQCKIPLECAISPSNFSSNLCILLLLRCPFFRFYKAVDDEGEWAGLEKQGGSGKVLSKIHANPVSYEALRF